MDDYLAGLPEAESAALEHVRDVVRRTVPRVEEGKSYGMPAFLVDGRPLLGFRAGKSHLSVFPFSPAAVDAVRSGLDGFDISRGTVRFTAARPIPDGVLETLVRVRLEEIEGR